jgi:hypothetical protein
MKVGLLRNHRAVILLSLSIVAPALAAGTASLDTAALATNGFPNTSTLHGKATAARSLTVKETAQLYQVGRHGAQHEEQGQGAGTFPYPLTVTYTAGFTQATVRFVVHGKGGAIYGQGTPAYHVEGSTAYFNGSLSVTRGTGRYAHASATALQLRGTLNRHNFALSIKVAGQMSL